MLRKSEYNIVGAALLPDLADVGPGRATHAAGGVLRLRLDRSLVGDLLNAEGEGAAMQQLRPPAASLTVTDEI